MKNSLTAIAIALLPLVLPGQRQDHVWVLGHNGGTTMDFNTSPPGITFADRDNGMGLVNASISDAEGNLLFYTNGCAVYNREFGVMQNGSNINPGSVHADNCIEPTTGYTVPRGAVILPKPGSDSLYYLFHQGLILLIQIPLDAFVNKQYYSIIDMSKNNGLGKVVEKNTVLVEDTLHSGDLSGVRHSNGSDWWVIMPKRNSNKYFKALLTPDGVEVQEQIAGDSTFGGSGGGQAQFSPDGGLFVRYNPQNDIMLFDFDRETGLLSNYRHVAIPGDSAFVGGLAISPSSRFLYVSSQVKFYQYDLWAADIAASQVLLGEYDGFQSPFATTFYLCQLAPDCKIYCNCYNSCNILHVVNYPDEPGAACGFVQHGVQLASSNALSIPNHPNYRLGTGAPPCTPVSGTGEAGAEAGSVSVFPNPASGSLRLAAPALPGVADFRLYAATGQAVRTWPVPTGQQEHGFPLGGLPPGLYFWQLAQEGRVLGSGRVVVVGH